MSRRVLPIETVIDVAELESGLVLARSIVDPRVAAYGEADEVLIELALFLGEHLRRTGALAQAAASLPGEVEARWIEVEVARPHPRERRVIPLRLAMPCAVVKHRRARWVIVLPLGLTVEVEGGEDLDAVVAAEARRQIAASELSATELLALFPPREHRLERIVASIEHKAVEGGVGALALRVEEAQRRRHALGVLRSVARPAHANDAGGVPPVGLERALATFDALLRGTPKMSVLLVGEERVGKSALVYAWLAQQAAIKRAPLVYATSGAQLIAGMSGLGQWQERVRRVMKALETLDAILWLDDLRDLFGDRGGTIDLPSALKPWIDEQRVRIVGELTPEAADLFASRQSGLFSLMHPLRVEPQDARAARAALRLCVEHAKRHEPDRPALATSDAPSSPDSIEAIVELTDRFLPYRPFPGKAVRLYEELRASMERAHRAERRTIEATDVYELFAVLTGIPVFLLRDDVAWRTERTTRFFEERIVGQREAIARVVDAIAVVKAGLAPGDRPLASFLFVGPTGVGKTALARALAELLFGSSERLVRFDMSELSSPDAAERLIRGTDSDEGLLTSRVRQQPFSVVLLDEIEKAHPAVFDLLLPILGEGRLTDARGRTAYFHDAIIVMTSNLGTQHRAQRLGIDPPAEDEGGRYHEAVRAAFRPELVNRIDRIIGFTSLDRGENRQVAARVLEKVARRSGLADLGVILDVSEAALDRLAEDGYREAYGARALRRHFEDALVAKVARLLAPLGARASHARVLVRAEGPPVATREPSEPGHRLAAARHGELTFDVIKGDRRPSDDPAILEGIAARRRAAQRMMQLPTVDEVAERVGYLLAELSYGKPERIDTRDRERMLGEHHALHAALDAAHATIAELESIEELALASALAGESPAALAEDARRAEVAFRASLLALLLAPEPRHAITLMLEEWDAHRPLDHWLGGLLRMRRELGWQVHGHVHRDPVASAPDWPTARAFGSARTADELAERLDAKERAPMTVLLTVRGPHAGVILALEAGLHRHASATPRGDEACLLVRSVGQRATLTEADFGSRALSRAPVPFPHERRLIPAVRTIHADHVEIDRKRARVDVSRARYWDDIRAIALTHLLLLEETQSDDKARLFASPLDGVPEGTAP